MARVSDFCFFGGGVGWSYYTCICMGFDMFVVGLCGSSVSMVVCARVRCLPPSDGPTNIRTINRTKTALPVERHQGADGEGQQCVALAFMRFVIYMRV